jgi:YHS domain-containing protein
MPGVAGVIRGLALVGLMLASPAVLIAGPPVSAKPNFGDPIPAKEALSKFNSLIGSWRGTAQPRRGSATGSWRESAEWAWDFSQPTPAIRYVVTDGQLLKSARITYDSAGRVYRARVERTNGSTAEYSGKFKDDVLVLDTRPSKGELQRITITPLNEKRTIVLFERKRGTASSTTRIAEVGYTREGTRLAVEGGDGPECVVTGGKGTIAINYKGQTYYVCCSGCKQAFNENPEKILAEYRQRVEARNKAAK